VTGIAFAGPFICVNTRLLKSFLGRCKSSINGGFQQLGYVAIRTKTKAHACILAIMRSLANDSNVMRQWSVRSASPAALVCFVSSFPVSNLPEVTESDLNLDGPSPFQRFVCPLPQQIPKAVPEPTIQKFSPSRETYHEAELSATGSEEREYMEEFGEFRPLPMGAVGQPGELDRDWGRLADEWGSF
jgi:hypothetical protein